MNVHYALCGYKAPLKHTLTRHIKSVHEGISHSCTIVKLGSLVSQTKWSNISERNSNLIGNLKKGPKLTIVQECEMPS